jgi:hypothetical protein
MTEKRPLFRPEAVEYHAQARSSGRALDLRERRTQWLFRGLLLTVLAAIALAFTLQAETTAHGTATVAGDGMAATLVVPDVRRVRPGQRVTLAVGGREVHGEVRAVDAGVEVALDEPATPGAQGKATIRLGRASIGRLLLGAD